MRSRRLNAALIATLLAAPTLIGPPVAAQGLEIGQYIFPDGKAAFADRVVATTPGNPAATDLNFTDPARTLGAPDYRKPKGAFSLGNGGTLVVAFEDNALVPSGDDRPDLVVFEMGTAADDSVISISADGETFIEVGRLRATTTAFDIDAVIEDPAARFSHVRIADVAGGGGARGKTAGADIDAIGAITYPAAEAPAVSADSAPAPSGAAVSIALNAGGGAVMQDGIAFQADAHFSDSRTLDSANPDAIRHEAFDGTVFETQRFGKEFAYSIPVGPGAVDVDLYFAERTQTRQGVRVFHVEVKGERVLRRFDILTEGGGREDPTNVHRLTGVDPAASGDPEALDIRFTTRRRNALLSAIRVRRCPDAAACAAEDAAEAARVAAALTERDAIERARWRGAWSGTVRWRHRLPGNIVARFESRLGELSLRLSDLGGVAEIRLHARRCRVAFAPSSRPEEMTALGADCTAGADMANFRLARASEDGLSIAITVSGHAWSTDLTRTVAKREGTTARPAGQALDLTGIELGASVAETKANVAAVITPPNPDAPWRAESSDAITAWQMVGRERGAGVAPAEHVVILAPKDGDGESAAIALARFWAPAEQDRPLAARLEAALKAKYGTEALSAEPGRMTWSFDHQGRPLPGGCGGTVIGQFAMPLGVRTATGADRTPIRVLSDCGYSLSATWSANTPADTPVAVMRFVVINHGALTDGMWERVAAYVADNHAAIIAKAGKAAADAAAEQERREGVAPKL